MPKTPRIHRYQTLSGVQAQRAPRDSIFRNHDRNCSASGRPSASLNLDFAVTPFRGGLADADDFTVWAAFAA